MALGRMTRTVQIIRRTNTPDSEGFSSTQDEVIKTVKAYREGRHGSEAWRNRASFTDATDMFTIRYPHFEVKTDMFVRDGDSIFTITSVENVKGRGMYVQILGREVVPSGEH